jgi:hypothetical protein
MAELLDIRTFRTSSDWRTSIYMPPVVLSLTRIKNKDSIPKQISKDLKDWEVSNVQAVIKAPFPFKQRPN